MDAFGETMTIGTLGAIFLGWLLGMLSPPIVDRIRNRYKEQEVKRAIFTELRDLQLRLVFVTYKLEGRFGTFDKALLEWVTSVLESYKGMAKVDNLLELSKQYLAFDDRAFQAIAEHQKAQPGGGLNVKKYRAPYLDSNIGMLGIFSEQSRAALLDIRAQLDFFNEEIDEARMYHKMTFDLSGSEKNHLVACQNVETCYRNLAQKARHIVERTGPILPQ